MTPRFFWNSVKTLLIIGGILLLADATKHIGIGLLIVVAVAVFCKLLPEFIRGVYFNACTDGNIGLAKFMLSIGANVDTVDKDGISALISAITHKRTEIVELLIAARANVEARNQYGEQTLVIAAEEGTPEIIKALIAAGADVNEVSEHGKSALVCSVMAKEKTAVKYLLEAGADFRLPDSWGTAMEVAISRGASEIVEILLDAGDSPDAEAKGYGTVLMLAASQGNEDIVRLLLDAGAKVNAKNERGWTALLYALKWEHASMAVVQALISAGADVNVKNNDGETALDLARDRRLFKSLLRAGADISQMAGKGGKAMENSIRMGDADMVKHLLAAGVDANTTIPCNKGPFSSRFGSNEESLLMIAAREGRRDIIDMLIEAGAHVNAGNKYGETALVYAVREGHTDIVVKLVEAGADCQAKACNGLSVADIARNLKLTEIGEILAAAGSYPKTAPPKKHTFPRCSRGKNRDALLDRLVEQLVKQLSNKF